MSCSQSLLPKVTIPNIAPSVTLFGSSVGDRRLFVSDNPESISASEFGTANMITLWNDTVSGRTTVKYRVFLWHLNKTSQPMKVGITLGNGSSGSTADTYQAKNFKTAVQVTPNFLSLGQCAATALVGNTLDTESTTVTIPANTVKTIKEWIVPVGQLVGGVFEFDINSPAGKSMVYKLRTVSSKTSSGDLSTHQGDAVKITAEHPRGTWNFSEVQGYSDSAKSQPITYSAGSGDKSFSCMNKTTDHLFTEAASYQGGTVKENRGQWGSIYNVNVKLSNNTGSTKNIKISLAPRGGAFVGGVQCNGVTNGVPLIKGPADSKDPTHEGVVLKTFSVANGATLNVPIKISAGGGGNTPIAILLQTV